MKPKQPLGAPYHYPDDDPAPRVPVLVDQPTAAPTRKLRYGSAGAAVAAIVVSVLSDQLGWQPGASVLEAVAYLVMIGVGAGLGAIAAGYPVRDYEA